MTTLEYWLSPSDPHPSIHLLNDHPTQVTVITEASKGIQYYVDQGFYKAFGDEISVGVTAKAAIVLWAPSWGLYQGGVDYCRSHNVPLVSTGGWWRIEDKSLLLDAEVAA